MELMSNESEYEKEYGDDDSALLRLARMLGGRGVAKREPAVEKNNIFQWGKFQWIRRLGDMRRSSLTGS
jgi:hypothetical protein